MKYKSLNICKNLRIVDISLLIFLFILLCQSAYNIIFHSDSNSFDVIVRTTAASIFGYFLSTRFSENVETNNVSENIMQRIETSDNTTKIQNKIGFSESKTELISGQIKDLSPKQTNDNSLQIIIVSFIGLFSLILLIILRNLDPWNNGSMPLTDSALSTVSQLRDFISSSIGFLIGYPVKQSKWLLGGNYDRY